MSLGPLWSPDYLIQGPSPKLLQNQCSIKNDNLVIFTCAPITKNTNVLWKILILSSLFQLCNNRRQKRTAVDQVRSKTILNQDYFLCFCVDRTSLPLWVEKDHKVLRAAWKILLLLNAYVTVTQPKCGETTLLDGFNSFQFISLIWIYFAVVWFNLELHWDGDKGREKDDKTSAVVGCTKCYQDQIQWTGNEIIISGSAQASCN